MTTTNGTSPDEIARMESELAAMKKKEREDRKKARKLAKANKKIAKQKAKAAARATGYGGVIIVMNDKKEPEPVRARPASRFLDEHIVFATMPAQPRPVQRRELESSRNLAPYVRSVPSRNLSPRCYGEDCYYQGEPIQVYDRIPVKSSAAALPAPRRSPRRY